MDDADEAIQWCLDNEVLVEKVVNGEPTMIVGPRCQELAPELYKRLMGELHATLLTLAAEGEVEYYYDEDTDQFLYELTDKAREILATQGYGYVE
jgi:hypothetical protein